MWNQREVNSRRTILNNDSAVKAVPAVRTPPWIVVKQKKLTSVTSIGMTVQSKLKINWKGKMRERSMRINDLPDRIPRTYVVPSVADRDLHLGLSSIDDALGPLSLPSEHLDELDGSDELVLKRAEEVGQDLAWTRCFERETHHDVHPLVPPERYDPKQESGV